MRKSITARRGTSIAAAALSFALVAPLAQPVAFAQDAPAAVAGAGANKEAQQGQGKNKQVPNAILPRAVGAISTATTAGRTSIRTGVRTTSLRTMSRSRAMSSTCST